MKHIPLIYFMLAGLFSLILIALPSCSAALGTSPLNEDIELIQTCNNCTYCNLTSIKYPNGTALARNEVMLQDGTYYNYTLNKTFVTEVGTYKYCYDCGNTDEKVTGCIDVIVTPSGQEKINTGEGLSLSIAVIAMIVVAFSFFFVSGAFRENHILRFALIGVGLILLLVVVGFSLISMMNNLGGFSTLITTYSSFFWVILIILVFITFMVMISLTVKAMDNFKVKHGLKLT